MSAEVKVRTESVGDIQENVDRSGLWAAAKRVVLSVQTRISKALERKNIVPTHAIMRDLLTKEMVKEFNRIRKDNPDYKPDLSNAYFIGKDLGGVNLKNTIAKRTRFDDSDLSGAILDGIILTGGCMDNAVLFESKINDALMNCVQADGADFSGAEMKNVNLDRSRVLGANFSGADMTEASLDKTDAESADFEGAILDRASIVETDLRLTNLQGASVKGVDFTRAQTAGAFFRGVKIDKETKLPEDMSDIIEEDDDLGETD